MRGYTGTLENGEAVFYRDRKRWFWLLSVLYPLEAFLGIWLHAETGNEAWLLLPLGGCEQSRSEPVRLIPTLHPCRSARNRLAQVSTLLLLSGLPDTCHFLPAIPSLPESYRNRAVQASLTGRSAHCRELCCRSGSENFFLS